MQGRVSLARHRQIANTARPCGRLNHTPQTAPFLSFDAALFPLYHPVKAQGLDIGRCVQSASVEPTPRTKVETIINQLTNYDDIHPTV